MVNFNRRGVRNFVPYNTLPITLVYRSIDRKVFRDQFCIECGHPFIAISDKYVTIIDSATPVQILRGHQRALGARCRHTDCKQHFVVEC